MISLAYFSSLKKRTFQRACFYHLVYSGRGSNLIEEDLSHKETREVVDLIIDKTKEAHDKGKKIEVLTVDNHADGPYVYLRLLKENPKRAKEVLELLQWNEGNSSGKGLACISWDGEVYADQFWRQYSFGNVRKRKFSEIWEDTSNELMARLKNKNPYVKGRCAGCRWLNICSGNFRARAEAYYGDMWEHDPACYLTDEEIGIESESPQKSETKSNYSLKIFSKYVIKIYCHYMGNDVVVAICGPKWFSDRVIYIPIFIEDCSVSKVYPFI